MDRLRKEPKAKTADVLARRLPDNVIATNVPGNNVILSGVEKTATF